MKIETSDLTSSEPFRYPLYRSKYKETDVITHTIPQFIIDIVPLLRFEYDTNGYYMKENLCCSLNRNLDSILEKKTEEFNQFKDEKSLFVNCAIAIQLMLRSLTKREFNLLKPKFKLKKYHYRLLRRLYIYADEDWDKEYKNVIDMGMGNGHKRPYGNSYIPGDISDEMGLKGGRRKRCNTRELVNRKKTARIHKQVLQLAVMLIKQSKFPYRDFQFNPERWRWQPI